MRTRPLLVGSAAASALLLGALSVTPAAAATAASPAKGVGTSTLSVLDLTAGGHTISIGGVSLSSDTVSGAPLATATITPLVVDGTAYGKQVITPASSPVSIPSQSSPGALGSIASLSSPAFAAAATNGPSSNAGAASLGSLSLLGLNVPLAGAVDLGTAVSKTSAIGQKSVNVTNLSLPSIGAILAALGLDVTKLPVGTITSLIEQLNLTTSAINTAQAGVDTIQGQVSAATIALSNAQQGLTAAQATQGADQAAVTSATATLNGLLAQVSPATVLAFPGANTIPGYQALSSLGIAAVESDAPGAAAASTALDNANAALAAANTAVTAAQAQVDAAQATLATVTATLTTALGAIDALATPVLNSTPLVSLDGFSFGSKALTTSNHTGGQLASIDGGTITGLHVLGTDVLRTALGVSSVNVTDLVGSQATALTSAINGVTGTLSSVLSTIPSLPTLSIPAPQVSVLTKTVATSISGGYGRALTNLQGLRIALPAITLPTALALPGASSLPALTGVTQVTGLLSSAPISLGLLSVSDQSAFAPAVIAGTPAGSVGNPQLPHTGVSWGVGAMAVLLMGAAFVIRRRMVVIAD